MLAIVLGVTLLAAGDTMGEADKLLRSGQYDAAARAYVALIDKEAANPKLWRGLGDALIRQGKYREALPALREATKLEPGNRDGQRLMARALVGVNSLQQAERLLNTLLTVDSKDVVSLTAYAELMYRNGYYEAALKALDTLQDLKAESRQTQVWRAVALFKVSRAKEGEVLARQLLRTAPPPNDVDLSLTLAEHLAESQRMMEAMPLVEQAIRFAPKDPIPPLYKARFLMRQGNVAGAIPAAENSIALNPELPFARSLLVQAYRQTGRMEEAKKQADWIREYEAKIGPKEGSGAAK